MSTRRERANRWWLRCPRCGKWKAKHLDPWTKTWLCEVRAAQRTEGESTSECRCTEGAYLGAQLAGEPIRCERCGGIVDEQAKTLLIRLYAEARADLEAWVKANPIDRHAADPEERGEYLVDEDGPWREKS